MYSPPAFLVISKLLESGILNDDTSYEGNIIPKEVIEEQKLDNKTKEYDSYIALIDALDSGEIDYIFLPTNYSVMFGSMEGYEDIGLYAA